MREENKKHGVALLYPLRTSAQKKNRANKLKAHFSACDIFLGNHCLRSSLCVFLFSLIAAKQWNRFFLLPLSIRIPFVLVDKRHYTRYRGEGENEREHQNLAQMT